MAIRTIFSRGYGNGTFSGTIALVALRGYSVGAEVLISLDFRDKKVLKGSSLRIERVG